MSILEEILEHKRREVEATKTRAALNELREKKCFSSPRVSLLRALCNTKPAIIAEVKKASPSKGIIRRDFDALAIAREYTQNGASALSVLTDEKFFRGDIRFIEQMKPFVTIPILRKDFIIDSYQLYEAKAFGADAVLLIAAALESSALHDLADEAKALGLECLVEVHSKEEIESLDFEKVRLVGINNRNLATFETDIALSVKLRPLIPNDVEVVSESGINSADDIQKLMKHGIHSFLIGETFMKAESPGKALAELRESIERRSA